MMLQVRAAEEDQPGGLGQALFPDGPQRGQVNIYTISTPYLHIVDTLSTQYLHRFARDEESLKMFKLISDFFLEELRLDWVTKAEIDHMVGLLPISTLYLNNIYAISTKYLHRWGCCSPTASRTSTRTPPAAPCNHVDNAQKYLQA